MSQATPYRITTQTGGGGTGTTAELRFAQRKNTDIVTNLNNLTQTPVPIDGALITVGSGWSINGNGIELTGPDSYVRCSFNLHVFAAVARANMVVRLAQNGTLFGPVSAHGYIRNNNGHQESSYTVGCTWTKMATGDIITVETLREAQAGTVTMAAAGTSQLLLERLVNV